MALKLLVKASHDVIAGMARLRDMAQSRQSRCALRNWASRLNLAQPCLKSAAVREALVMADVDSCEWQMEMVMVYDAPSSPY